MKFIHYLKQSLIGLKVSFYINFDPNHLKIDTIKSFIRNDQSYDITTEEGYQFTIDIYEELYEENGVCHIQTFATRKLKNEKQL